MEGVFGILSFNSQVDQEILDRMALALGSGAEASFAIDGQFGVGVQRLPLVAETQTPEPSWSGDGSLCVAINGEIHNCLELRHRLERRGYMFSSNSDAELVANLYRDRGEEFVKELNGLFVVAIWDRREQEVILAQDRYGGIRQLYYASLPNALMFASGIRPILASGKITPQVDEGALIEFFTIGHILPPHTMFQGVQKLIPGYVLRCRQGSLSTRRVHWFTFTPELEAGDTATLQEYYAEAVRKGLVADRPVGLLLSGGLDSSLNVAMASKLADRPLDTFSVRFADLAVDESPYARLVANHFGTDHHELALESSDVLEVLPQMVWCQEEPQYDFSAVPSYHLARFAKSHVDAVIAGDGPDHLWGRFSYLATRRQFSQALPGSRLLRRLLPKNLDGGFSPYYVLRTAQKLAQAAHVPVQRIYRDRWINLLYTEGAARVLSQVLKAKCREGGAQTQLVPEEVTNDFNQLVVLDFLIEGSFGVFAKFGKVAAGHSLLVREPYFDTPLVDYINRLPEGLKVRGTLWQRLRGTAGEKYLLRHGLGQQLLPQAILSKPKQGFVPPIAKWLKDKLQELGPDTVLSSSLEQAAYFDIAFIEDRVKEHLSGVADNSITLYMLLVFNVWHKLYIDSLAMECPTITLTDLLREQDNI